MMKKVRDANLKNIDNISLADLVSKEKELDRESPQITVIKNDWIVK